MHRAEFLSIEKPQVAAYTVPTDAPESDGTLEWSATTLVVLTLSAGGMRGLGYGYADGATARLIADRLAPLLEDRDACDIPARKAELERAVRNLGRPGICAMALSIVDVALWDLKAKILGVSLARLLGRCRDAVPAYGSGGFTSYSVERLREQLGGWASDGLRFVKMKIGRDPHADLARVREARSAIGETADLFVDANGAYSRKQALAQAEAFAQSRVAWFEEPVSSDDLEGLRLLRDRAPAGMAVSAGEYGYTPWYFRRMLEAGAVDVLQADATRCGGVSGFLEAAALCSAHHVPISSHCAPSLHAALCCTAAPAIHLEYFHDHARIEQTLFDGAARPRNGLIAPDLERPGLGLDLKTRDAEKYRS